MYRTIFNEGSINGHCITGDKNKIFNLYIMPSDLNQAILSLANSQAKLAEAIAQATEKRAEADLIKAQTDKICAENYAKELQIRESENKSNNMLIQTMYDTLVKINDRLDK